MALNEAAGFRRGGLTTKQKQEQMAAIYGLNPKDYSDMSPQLTHQEIERMRQIVAAADAKSGGIKEFDLNNPPKEQYRHQEYPRLMYHHRKAKTQVAHSQEDVETFEAQGWSKLPPPTVKETEMELDAEATAEAAKLDEIARRPRDTKKAS